MIKRLYKYTGECTDCADKDDCRYGTECPFIDNENRLKSHRKKGLVVRYVYGCLHYRAIGADNINEESENARQNQVPPSPVEGNAGPGQ